MSTKLFHLSIFIFRSEALSNITCAQWDPATNLLYLGGAQDTMIVFDVDVRSERALIPLKEDDCAMIRITERFLVTANSSGKACLYFTVLIISLADSSEQRPHELLCRGAGPGPFG